MFPLVLKGNPSPKNGEKRTLWAFRVKHKKELAGSTEEWRNTMDKQTSPYLSWSVWLNTWATPISIWFTFISKRTAVESFNSAALGRLPMGTRLKLSSYPNWGLLRDIISQARSGQNAIIWAIVYPFSNRDGTNSRQSHIFENRLGIHPEVNSWMFCNHSCGRKTQTVH